MLRRDFILKLIEQFAKDIARLLDSDFEKEPEKFIDSFEALLKSYYKIDSGAPEELCLPDDARDVLLLDEKMKNPQLRFFATAGIAFLQKGENHKAAVCMQIIDRIQDFHQNLFEFPHQESQLTADKIQEFRFLLEAFQKD
ncbi:MAG: hypothetical protein WDA08_08080 [Weeksellaceae bacterium]